jgi:hypothetical protein
MLLALALINSQRQSLPRVTPAPHPLTCFFSQNTTQSNLSSDTARWTALLAGLTSLQHLAVIGGPSEGYYGRTRPITASGPSSDLLTCLDQLTHLHLDPRFNMTVQKVQELTKLTALKVSDHLHLVSSLNLNTTATGCDIHNTANRVLAPASINRCSSSNR